MSGECNNSALGGGNPCNVRPPANTAACEALPSQIENFTLNFFGEVFKTEVDGVVQWSLPGRLDVGLPLNPRGATEPLGCYFIRLFEDGIIGGKGPMGDPGLPGCNGSTPYVQVLNGGFPQPSLGFVFAAKVTKNPSLRPGMDVFVDGSGWYEIKTSDGLGNITLVLRKSVINPVSWVDQGTVLLPSGKVGGDGAQGVQGIPGPVGFTGLQGIVGDQGPVGPNGAGNSAGLPLFKAIIPTFAVNFPSSANASGYMGGLGISGFSNVVLLPGSVPCTITLPKAGVYLIFANVGWGSVPTSGGGGTTFAQAQPGINEFRVKNVSTNTVLSQSTIRCYGASMLVCTATTIANNNVVQMQAQAITTQNATITIYSFWALKLS